MNLNSLGLDVSLGAYAAAVENRAAELQQHDFVRRTWAKDASLWSEDAAAKAIIENALGWLTVVDLMRGRLEELRALAAAIRPPDYNDVVLLGMGGSSLAPEVMRLTFGRQPGRPTLHVLDTTHPDPILAVRRQIDPARSLFVVASKSGGTIETACLNEYFWGEVRAAGVANPGANFVAITDAGTAMAKLARERRFRHICLNPADIGGRYSALSYFGLVPMALQGLDVAKLLQRAGDMAHRCSAQTPAAQNPGLWLGTIIGELARHGRDKLTLVTPSRLDSFGLWVEQLVAESSGKLGRGILPVAGGNLGLPDTYGNDRLFVSLGGAAEASTAASLASFNHVGHPTVRLTVHDDYDLAAQFFLWEIAVATACAIIGVNAFDQPNVQQAKDITKQMLAEWERHGQFDVGQPAVSGGGVAVYGQATGNTPAEAIRAFWAAAEPGEYVALLAYLEPEREAEAVFSAMRDRIRRDRHVATTFGWGPRYLHSTGQLHKGGPPTGRFIEFTDDPAGDAPVPGQPYTFATLVHAEAFGDERALAEQGRPVLRVHLGPNPRATLPVLAAELGLAG